MARNSDFMGYEIPGLKLKLRAKLIFSPVYFEELFAVKRNRIRHLVCFIQSVKKHPAPFPDNFPE